MYTLSPARHLSRGIDSQEIWGFVVFVVVTCVGYVVVLVDVLVEVLVDVLVDVLGDIRDIVSRSLSNTIIFSIM